MSPHANLHPNLTARYRLPLQAKDELNETDEKRVAAVKELRGMMADGTDDLAKSVQDTFGEKPDSLLVRFIRARKYDVNRAFDLMKGRTTAQDPHNLAGSPNQSSLLLLLFIHSLLYTQQNWHIVEHDGRNLAYNNI